MSLASFFPRPEHLGKAQFRKWQRKCPDRLACRLSWFLLIALIQNNSERERAKSRAERDEGNMGADKKSISTFDVNR